MTELARTLGQDLCEFGYGYVPIDQIKLEQARSAAGTFIEANKSQQGDWSFTRATGDWVGIVREERETDCPANPRFTLCFTQDFSFRQPQRRNPHAAKCLATISALFHDLKQTARDVAKEVLSADLAVRVKQSFEIDMKDSNPSALWLSSTWPATSHAEARPGNGLFSIILTIAGGDIFLVDTTGKRKAMITSPLGSAIVLPGKGITAESQILQPTPYLIQSGSELATTTMLEVHSVKKVERSATSNVVTLR